MIGTTTTMAAHIKNLAVRMEHYARDYGLHIALTGGQLYKDGHRKDIDFIVYHENSEYTTGLNAAQRERQVECFFQALWMDGFSNFVNYGRVTKCTYGGDSIDILYPEYTRLGEYIVETLESPDRKCSYLFPQTEILPTEILL